MPRALTDDEVAAFRSKLCEVATRLFAENGYATVTLRALAKELGVSAMTPYRYFSGKDEILAAARQSGFEHFADSQRRAFDASSDPAARIRAMMIAYHRFALAYPNHYRILFELRRPEGEEGYPDLQRAVTAAYQPIQKAVGAAIEAGVFEGDTEVIAHAIWSGCHGLVSLELADMLILGKSIEDLEERIIDQIFAAYGKGGLQRRRSA